MVSLGNTHPSGEALSAYVDGELDAQVCLEVERHLRRCVECRLRVDNFRGSSSFFQRLPTQRVPASLRRDTYRRIDEQDHRRLPILSWLPLPSANTVGLLVTALLMVIMAPQIGGLWGMLFRSSATTQDDRAAQPTHAPLVAPVVTVSTGVPSATGMSSATAVVSTATAPSPATSPSPAATAKVAPEARGPAGGAPLAGATPTAVAPAVPTPRPAAAAAVAAAGSTATKPAASTVPPQATSTSTPLAPRKVGGQVSAVDRINRTMSVTSSEKVGQASAPPVGTARTWQIALPPNAAIIHANGRTLIFEEIGVADQVEVEVSEAQQAPGSLTATSVRVLVSAVPPTPAVNRSTRVLVLLDGVTDLRPPQYGQTGDWIKRLSDTGYHVTPVEPARISGGSAALKDFGLIVIGSPATLSASAIQSVKESKVPVLNADPRLVQPLGLGMNLDPAQPGRSVPGKTVEIAGSGSPLTRDFSGEVVVANNTLYHTPIVASGAVLGAITDGGQKRAVWSLTGSMMYFGFWSSADGQNHNAAYWTLFDRSVLMLSGRDAPVTVASAAAPSAAAPSAAAPSAAAPSAAAPGSATPPAAITASTTSLASSR